MTPALAVSSTITHSLVTSEGFFYSVDFRLGWADLLIDRVLVSFSLPTWRDVGRAGSHVCLWSHLAQCVRAPPLSVVSLEQGCVSGGGRDSLPFWCVCVSVVVTLPPSSSSSSSLPLSSSLAFFSPSAGSSSSPPPPFCLSCSALTLGSRWRTPAPPLQGWRASPPPPHTHSHTLCEYSARWNSHLILSSLSCRQMACLGAHQRVLFFRVMLLIWGCRIPLVAPDWRIFSLRLSHPVWNLPH